MPASDLIETLKTNAVKYFIVATQHDITSEKPFVISFAVGDSLNKAYDIYRLLCGWNIHSSELLIIDLRMVVDKHLIILSKSSSSGEGDF